MADTAGNLFIADSQNHVIRKIDRNGLVTTFTGRAGTPGSNNGGGSQVRFRDTAANDNCRRISVAVN